MATKAQNLALAAGSKVDASGNVEATTVDGIDSSQFVRSDTDDSITGNLSVTGNISITGTVDGRDLAADGSKLDGVATGADVTNTVNDNLPTIRPSLLLDFANGKTLDPRIDFTRSSTATYWDGKTTAKAEENLCNNSQSGTTGWYSVPSSATSADNVATAPDGTTTASSLTVNAGATERGSARITTSTTARDQNVTMSIYAKVGSGCDWIAIQEYYTSLSPSVTWFNISTGTVGTSSSAHDASITSVGNGWYRLEITLYNYNTGYDFWMFNMYDGDGSTNQTADGSYVYLWGWQFEARSSATAYTPTTSTPITRYQPVLQTASANQPRFDHDPVTGESKGLLIEEARTNLVTQSATMSNWSSLNLWKYSNYGTAPDGTQTATLLVPNSTSTTNYFVSFDTTSTVGSTYTYSAYVKSAGQNYAVIHAYNCGTASFNFTTGAFENINPAYTSTHVEFVGNGWWRIALTYVVTTATGIYIGGSNTTSYGYTPDNTHDGILVWGVQQEPGSFPTSYIPTSGSQVTRSYDVAIIQDDNFYSWFNDEQGTVFMEGTGYSRGYSLSDKSSSDRYFSNFNYSRHIYVITTGTNTWNSNTTQDSPNESKKHAFAYALGDQAVTDNGSSVLTRTGSGARHPYGLKRLSLGSGYNGAHAHLGGHIKKFTYYPARLPNATLQAMTEE